MRKTNKKPKRNGISNKLMCIWELCYYDLKLEFEVMKRRDDQSSAYSLSQSWVKIL